MRRTFNPNLYLQNGALLVTKVLNSMCNGTALDQMTPQICNGFSVLNKSVCYPVWTEKNDDFFSFRKNDETMKLLNNSHMVNFWNSQTIDLKLGDKEESIYDSLAKTYCPRLFSVTENF